MTGLAMAMVVRGEGLGQRMVIHVGSLAGAMAVDAKQSEK